MHLAKPLIVVTVAGLLSTGCIVVPTYEPVPPPPPPPQAEVVAGPVIEAPGVVLVDVEPPPEERVYVYDPGFPPGVYFYDNYYWYGGYRYPHDVFINQYVTRNVRENRYTRVDENRRQGYQMEARQRADFARTRGIRPQARPEVRRDDAARHDHY
jgi:hypothetical protein